MGKLTVARVKNAKPGIGKDGQPIKATFQDGQGLFLNCAPTGAKSWILRVQADGMRRDIGLGAADVDSPFRYFNLSPEIIRPARWHNRVLPSAHLRLAKFM